MSDPVLIGVISAIGAILAAVLVELVRTRRSVRAELTPNGGSSLRDQTNRIESKVDGIDARQDAFGERLASVETSVDHLRGR